MLAGRVEPAARRARPRSSRSEHSAIAAPDQEPIDDPNRAAACAAGLIHITDRSPGYRRRKVGKNFIYVDTDGQRVADATVLARIRSLAIPPAYTDVWICRHPRGHLQATGRDARGRKQYRYHGSWRSQRDDGKFVRLQSFGAALPRLRRRLQRDLSLQGLPRERLLALIVELLSQTLARVGNETYVKANRSFGLTTLRNRHLASVRGTRACLKFRGKSGLDHRLTVDDARIARILRRCHPLPGQHLFQYLDDDGSCHPVDSGMVNAYLSESMGGAFTAKDFRTWGGTLNAIALLARTPVPEPDSERAVASVVLEVVRAVAATLRNTPAVCRKSYIDPRVFAAWRSGRLQQLASTMPRLGGRQLEALALKLLDAPMVSPQRRRSRKTPARS